MLISAIYFKDKDVWHVKADTWYSYDRDHDHLRINGKIVQRNGSGNSDYTVEGKELKVEAGRKHTIIQCYLHRERQETLSVPAYTEQIASFKEPNGKYKDLDSEYMCRRMEQSYIPIHYTYYEYEEVPVLIQEAYFQPDKYTECTGWIKKRDSEKYPNFFVFRFNKREFCNDTVKRLMVEFGIPKVEKKPENSTVEYYILDEDRNSYTWLQLCKNEYFIRSQDMFGSDGKENFVYCTYTEIEGIQKEIEQSLRKRIEQYLDCVRTVNVKKSDIAALKNELLNLQKDINNKKRSRFSISNALNTIYYKLCDCTKTA